MMVMMIKSVSLSKPVICRYRYQFRSAEHSRHRSRGGREALHEALKKENSFKIPPKSWLF